MTLESNREPVPADAPTSAADNAPAAGGHVLPFPGRPADAPPSPPLAYRPLSAITDYLHIYFYLDSVPFTRDVLEGRTSLGGSESAMVMTAKALAARGHTVQVYAAKLTLKDGDPTVYDGVSWHSNVDLVHAMQSAPPDVFVSLRSTAPFAMRLDSGLNLLWNQDLLTHPGYIGPALPQIDAMVYVSEFHKRQWHSQPVPREAEAGDLSAKTIALVPSMVTTNVFDPAQVPMWPETREGQIAAALAVKGRVEARTQAFLEANPEPAWADRDAHLAWVERLQLDRHPLGCKEGEICQPGCEIGDAIAALVALQADGYARPFLHSPDAPAIAPADIVPYPRQLTRFCHISRPERGLDPLLAMWPEIRKRVPDAELHLCRYSSMYDQTGWGAVCAEYDAKVAAVHQQVGGIVWHGELNKAQLYQLLTSCSLMLYPGNHDFAETSCIAAIEAQACGCVFVGSYKGALPETVGEDAGVLIDGDPETEEYRDSFVETVYTLADPVEGPPLLAAMREAGRAHVYPRYTPAYVAEQWENWIAETFRERFAANKLPILRQLLHYDAHVAAKLLAEDIMADVVKVPMQNAENEERLAAILKEAEAAITLCDDVITQRAQTAEHYGQYALDTELEAAANGRFHYIIEQLAQKYPPPPMKDGKPVEGADPVEPRVLLDVACGNGSFALALLKKMPHFSVIGLDYSSQNVERAHAACEKHGIDPARFRFLNVDLGKRPTLAQLNESVSTLLPPAFDAVFCGEYVEHTAEPHLVLDWLESFLYQDGWCFVTVPHGPLSEAIPYNIPVQRGHTHHFQLRDLGQLLAPKGESVLIEYLNSGVTPRGHYTGFWIIQWRRGGLDQNQPCAPINHWRTIYTTRPYSKVVGAMIVRDVEAWITKCLHSTWALVDDLVVVDTGSSDRTEVLMRAFPNVRFYTWAQAHTALSLAVEPWPSCGFAHARNLSRQLAEDVYKADWVLWFDADEFMVGGEHLHGLTKACSIYNGYVIRQRHLSYDEPVFEDKPTRLFRAGRQIAFDGLVHEAPQMPDTDVVFPTIDTPLLTFVHLGYETMPIRVSKLQDRNAPLLRKEMTRKSPPPRRMAYVLYMRDLVTIAQLEGAKQGQLTARTRAMLEGVTKLYHVKGFDNPDDPKHEYAFPYYQRALELLGAGFELITNTQGQQRSPRGEANRPPIRRAHPERLFVMTLEEGERLLQARRDQLFASLRPPKFLVRPFDNARPADVVPVPYERA